MRRVINGRSKKTGMPPGTLVHIGEKKIDTVKITQFIYDENNFERKVFSVPDDKLITNDRSKANWVNIEGIHDTNMLSRIGELFGLHPLVMEDILNTEQRPKIDDCGDYIFIVAKMVHFENSIKDFTIDQISLILGDGFVVSFQEKGEEFCNMISERLEKGIGKMRKSGPDYLIYAILDAIVDNYFNVLEKFGDKIEYMEDAILLHSTDKLLQNIHQLKRDMLFIHKSIWPLREVLGTLERGEIKFIQPSTGIYFRDVYDHIIQAMDTTETYRDMMSSMLDIYLSSVSNRMNEVMKVLTVFSTIFLPITFIVGVYGMNFKGMHELEWDYGYPAVWLIMISIAASMFIYFKKKKWI